MGRYDKYFPLYAITDTDDPKYILTAPTNEEKTIKGDLEPKLYRDKYKHRHLGKKEKPTGIFNSNLDFKDLYYKEWFSVKLNPAWTVLQTDGTAVTHLIRCLGNNYTLKNVHAFSLDDNNKLDVIAGTFPKGIVVLYKKNLWKCIKDTNKYPPTTLPTKTSPINVEWQSLATSSNVFHADIFSTGKDSNFKYTRTVTEDNRNFNPTQEKDDTLVSWNVAYFNE